MLYQFLGSKLGYNRSDASPDVISPLHSITSFDFEQRPAFNLQVEHFITSRFTSFSYPKDQKTVLDFSSLKQLKSLVIKYGSFQDITQVTIQNSYLQYVIIEDHCFISGEGSLRIFCCDKLHVISIGRGSFLNFSTLSMKGVALNSLLIRSSRINYTWNRCRFDKQHR